MDIAEEEHASPAGVVVIDNILANTLKSAVKLAGNAGSAGIIDSSIGSFSICSKMKKKMLDSGYY